MSQTSKTLYKIITAALFAALTCVTTMLPLPVPSLTGGYINFGDCFVLLCGWLLGPMYGFAAAAVGSALTDIIGGYIVYAPATFIIKGLMAVCAYYVFRVLPLKKNPVMTVIARVLSAICGEIIMIAGYFLYAATVMGYGIAGAAADIASNAVQAAAGIIASTIIITILDQTGLRKKMLRGQD